MNQLIWYLIVPENYEATLFAAQGMLEGESGITTVAGGGEVGWSDAISHGYGVTELLSGEFRPVDGRRQGGQPGTSVLSALDGPASISS